MATIGIGITTKDRNRVFEKSYKHILKYAPKDSKIVVVDDAGKKPPKQTTFHFNQNVGIATAKNKCLELLSDCEHIFLFDDDCFPKRKDWEKPYINSGIKHLSFTFDKIKGKHPNGRNRIFSDDNISVYEEPCGCMLYIHKSVIETIGGFNPDFALWGHEHIDFSNRAFNAGLTPYRICDVKNSQELLFSLDQHKKTKSTIPSQTKKLCLDSNLKLYNRRTGAADFIPIIPKTDGVILASFFNYCPDPQRNQIWEPDKNILQPLINSCCKLNIPIKIFSNCFKNDNIFINVPESKDSSPATYRWSVYLDYLKNNKHEQVFMVDSTDVIVLKNPFSSLNPNSIYSGDEVATLNNKWLKDTQESILKIPDYKSIIEPLRNETLLNCGIVGGHYNQVMKYLKLSTNYHSKFSKGITRSTDMAVHNYIVRKYFNQSIVNGIKINTRFKYEERNEISFFKHK